MKRAARSAEVLVQRTLATVGGAQSEQRIAADAQGYWSEPDGQRWRGNSHWRDAAVFETTDLWSRMGAQHLAMFERAARALERPGPYGRVVDWGCGGGANAVHFAPRSSELVGVDISAETVAECGRQVAAVCDTAYRPLVIDVAAPETAVDAIGAGAADVFLCFYVLELVPTPEYGARVMRIARDLLSSGGMALVQIKYSDGGWWTRPRRRSYRSGLAEMTTYRIEAFWELAADCGLRPEMVELVPRNELDERYAYFVLSKP